MKNSLEFLLISILLFYIYYKFPKEDKGKFTLFTIQRIGSFIGAVLSLIFAIIEFYRALSQ